MYKKSNEVIEKAWENAFRKYINKNEIHEKTLMKNISIICDFELSTNFNF